MYFIGENHCIIVEKLGWVGGGGGGAINGGKFHGEQIIGNLSKKVMYCIHPYIRPRGRCIFQKGGYYYI